MLPDRRLEAEGWEPSLPLILAAWWDLRGAKMMRLEEHIRWAEQHGALEDVAAFLRGLREEDWYHIHSTYDIRPSRGPRYLE